MTGAGDECCVCRRATTLPLNSSAQPRKDICEHAPKKRRKNCKLLTSASSVARSENVHDEAAPTAVYCACLDCLYCFAAATKPWKQGDGEPGQDRNSGWYCNERKGAKSSMREYRGAIR